VAEEVSELGRRWRKLFWEHGREAAPVGLADSAREYLREPDYVGFENRMRGGEATVREKQRLYVTYFRDRASTPGCEDGGYVLDVGCGRGEFLELARQEGVAARGVDLLIDNVLHCRDKGLDVAHGDALEHLSSLPDESLAGVFAAQFIEHLPVDYLVAFVRACFQKVRPGGRVILETINPECVVAMKNFYADLSHQKPIPAATARFLLETSGFANVETLYLSPHPESDSLQFCSGDSPLVAQINRAFDRLNRLLFGPQDYAVVATR
jgi:O-antigen chain-terminating methyltransferase